MSDHTKSIAQTPYIRQDGFPCCHEDHGVSEDGHEAEVSSQFLLLSHAVHVLLVADRTLLLRDDTIVLEFAVAGG